MAFGDPGGKGAELAVVAEEVLSGSAGVAADLIRRRQVSSVELTRLVLERIDAVNPRLNAVVELRQEAALQEAAAADKVIARGGQTGPLHGVPMTIKEAFNVAGQHTTWGNPEFRDFVADWDATVVRRLRQAGAVITGKTNVALPRRSRVSGQERRPRS
jgi:amidase